VLAVCSTKAAYKHPPAVRAQTNPTQPHVQEAASFLLLLLLLLLLQDACSKTTMQGLDQLASVHVCVCRTCSSVAMRAYMTHRPLPLSPASDRLSPPSSTSLQQQQQALDTLAGPCCKQTAAKPCSVMCCLCTLSKCQALPLPCAARLPQAAVI
jgi:hypothetical protein